MSTGGVVSPHTEAGLHSLDGSVDKGTAVMTGSTSVNNTTYTSRRHNALTEQHTRLDHGTHLQSNIHVQRTHHTDKATYTSR